MNLLRSGPSCSLACFLLLSFRRNRATGSRSRDQSPRARDRNSFTARHQSSSGDPAGAAPRLPELMCEGGGIVMPERGRSRMTIFIGSPVNAQAAGGNVRVPSGAPAFRPGTRGTPARTPIGGGTAQCCGFGLVTWAKQRGWSGSAFTNDKPGHHKQRFPSSAWSFGK